MKKRLFFNNENGYTLIIAVLTLVVISVLGLGLMSTTASTMKKTSSERDNQSAYYIAESGITQERVEIKKLAKEAFDETNATETVYINALKDHQEPAPAPFDFQTEFIKVAKSKINAQYTNLPDSANLTVINASDLKKMSSKVTYTKQKGIEPTSTTTVKPDLENSTSKKLIYTIQSTGKIGDNNKRTISQKIQISLDPAPGKKEVVIEDKKDTTPSLNACYAVYTSGSINSGNGKINGDIYSTEDININGWPTLKSIYSQKNITINGGEISGDVVALNNITITHWINIGGHYKYGNSFSNTTSSQETSKASQLTSDEKEKFFDESSLKNSCTVNIPKLENADTVFKSPNLPTYPNKTIASTDGSGTSFDFINDGILTVNSKAINQTLTLDSDIYLKKINVTGNETLNIDLKGQSRSLYVDSLDLAGKINLVNPGTLNLYVKNQLNTAYGSINENGKSSQANIYYSGSDKLTLASNINLTSSLHVKNADLTLTSGSKVKGNIFVYGNNKVEVSGGSKDVEQLFLAPNSDFVQSGGGTINGNIVAKNYTNSGGATVNPPTKTDQPGTNPGGASNTTIEMDDYPDTTDDFLFVQSQIEENGEKEN